MRAILRALLLLVISCQAWALGLADLTDKDASGGLREALVQGASKAVGQLGTDGGFLNNPKVKIGLPASLAPVEGMLRTMGRGKDLDALVETMNKAAEQAVPKAKVLLVDAVKKMSVEDAKRILSGGDDSATQYFKEKTSAQRTVSRIVRKGVPMLGIESISAAPPYSTRCDGLHSAIASSVSEGAQRSSMQLSPWPICSLSSKVSVGACIVSRRSKKPAGRLNCLSPAHLIRRGGLPSSPRAPDRSR